MEEHHAGCDRQRVREHRSGAGGLERVAALEAELDRDERKAVRGEQDGDQERATQPPKTAPFVATSPAA